VQLTYYKKCFPIIIGQLDKNNIRKRNSLIIEFFFLEKILGKNRKTVMLAAVSKHIQSGIAKCEK